MKCCLPVSLLRFTYLQHCFSLITLLFFTILSLCCSLLLISHLPLFIIHILHLSVFFCHVHLSSLCISTLYVSFFCLLLYLLSVLHLPFLRLGEPLTSKAIKIFVGSSTNTLHSLPTTTSSMLQIYCYKNRHLCKKSLIATGISSSLYWSMWLVLCCMISVELIRLSS